MTFWLRIHNWVIKTRSTWFNLMHKIAWCLLRMLWSNHLRVLIDRVEAHILYLSNKFCFRVIIDLVQKWADKINSRLRKWWANKTFNNRKTSLSRNINRFHKALSHLKDLINTIKKATSSILRKKAKCRDNLQHLQSCLANRNLTLTKWIQARKLNLLNRAQLGINTISSKLRSKWNLLLTLYSVTTLYNSLWRLIEKAISHSRTW